jgi:hypothetical protein
VALEGTLRDFSLADIFQLISLQRKTGVLSLRSSEDVVTISFLEGRVVGSDSLNKRLEDRLGQVLLRTHRVSRDDLEAALREQMETLERLGHILIRRGVLSKKELRYSLEQQILQVIFRVFRWQDGEYHFSQETSVDFDAELVNPMGAESILMEGARMLDEWPIIEKRIPHRAMLFVVTPAAAHVEVVDAHFEEEFSILDLDATPAPLEPRTGDCLRISPLERDVLALVDGRNTVEEIVQSSSASEFETYKALYGLLNRGLIRDALREEIARMLRQSDLVELPPATRGFPIPPLFFVVMLMLAASLFLMVRNPANPILGPTTHMQTLRLGSTLSWARLYGIWQALEARTLLAGDYPESLAELVQEHNLPPERLSDPWGRPYRYIMRENSVVLAGTTPLGVPDASLIFTRTISSEADRIPRGPGAILLTP